MKARLIEVGLHTKQSIFVKKIDQHHFETPFHFHDLCEMNYVVEGFGKTIVGDNISNFSSGDLVLMNSNLPHIWYNDPVYFQENTSFKAKAIVTYFDPDFLANLTKDEFYEAQIQAFLKKAERGVRFFGKTKNNAIRKLNAISEKEGLEKVIYFLDVIYLLLNSQEYEHLASIGYRHSFNERDTIRMNNIYQHLIKNFTEKITLSQIAAVANLTPPAFCNFFKKRTQKSFSEFLNELRVGHACKLLQNRELTISDVCFQSGYQNMTNFNKFFKKIAGKTPSNYRSELGSL